MLYEELSDRTGGYATYEEYEAINALYAGTSMTKETAAQLWKLKYGQGRGLQNERGSVAHSIMVAEAVARDPDRCEELCKKVLETYAEAKVCFYFDPFTRSTFTLVLRNMKKMVAELCVLHEISLDKIGTYKVAPCRYYVEAPAGDWQSLHGEHKAIEL